MKERLINMEDINRKNNGYVGADDSVRPLLKKNTQRGITLVALVITIIVLLILAMVSIRIAVGENGLINKAKEAKDIHTIATEKEAIQTGYAAYKIDKANGKNVENPTIDGAYVGDLNNGIWPVKFKATGNYYPLNEDGTITADTSTEKEKIKKAYETLIGKRKNVTNKDYLTVVDYFYGFYLDDLIDYENMSEDDTVIKFKGISAIIDLNSPNMDENNGVFAITYNNIEYLLTVNSENGRITKITVINNDNTRTELNISIPEIEETIISGNISSGFIIKFDSSGSIYKLLVDGTILGPLNSSADIEIPKNDDKSINFETIKANLKTNTDKYLEGAAGAGQNTISNQDIGIGTDGKVVNLDSWMYTLNSLGTVRLGDGGGSAAGTPAYKGIYNSQGKITGTIPQIIYSNGKIYEVTEATKMFNSEKLKIAPEIPTTVTNCTNMFSLCTNLKVSPKIPEGVTNCSAMFYGCTSLEVAPEIPTTVTNMENMLQKCVNLSGEITINSTPTKYTLMLQNVGNANKKVILRGQCQADVLEKIRQTGNSTYITINK